MHKWGIMFSLFSLTIVSIRSIVAFILLMVDISASNFSSTAPCAQLLLLSGADSVSVASVC